MKQPWKDNVITPAYLCGSITKQHRYDGRKRFGMESIMMKKKTALWMTGLLALCLLAAGCAKEDPDQGTAPTTETAAETQQESTEEESTSQETGGILSSFTAVDLNGEERDETIFEGYKLTMVNIWATYCAPCIREMPDLGVLHQEYEEEGFQIVGVVADAMKLDFKPDETVAEEARAIVEETGADYLHLIPSLDIYRAKIQYMIGVPETIFVNEKGEQVGDSYLGAKSMAEWQEIIEQLLQETES